MILYRSDYSLMVEMKALHSCTCRSASLTPPPPTHTQTQLNYKALKTYYTIYNVHTDSEETCSIARGENEKVSHVLYCTYIALWQANPFDTLCK